MSSLVKVLTGAAGLAAVVGFATPAAAQYYPGYGYNNGGVGRRDHQWRDSAAASTVMTTAICLWRRPMTALRSTSAAVRSMRAPRRLRLWRLWVQ